MLCRKNQATLTASERARFVAAVLALKADGSWDRFVAVHGAAHMDAHRGPAFFPWHREYLRRLELELRRIDSSVTLPYWDWSVDNSPTSSIWNPDFMGGDGRPGDLRVMSGPFAFDAGQWRLVHGGVEYLQRQFGRGAPTLPTPGDLATTLATVPYDVAGWNTSSPSGFRNRAEGWIAGPQMHNRVHVWVGGSMLPLTSPNDPVFFLHHCFVDKLWASWQKQHPGEGYLPVSGAAAGHNLHNAMQPWADMGEIARPSTVLDHHALGYAYDDEPECGGKATPKIEKFEVKEGKLEKIEIKEFKREKIEKPELKERKREKFEKPERKEIKQEKFEKLEQWESKDAMLEKSPVQEGKEFGELPLDDPGIDGVQPVQAAHPEHPGDLTESVSRLADTVNELRHFIGTQLRPDLSGGALRDEPDVDTPRTEPTEGQHEHGHEQ